MADESLSVQITADTATAATNLSAFESRLSALEAAYKRTSETAKIATTAVSETGTAAVGATGKVEGLGLALEQMSGHARTVGIALNAAGLESGAAVAKIDGLAAAFKGLQGAIGPLVLLLVGIEVAMKGFAFFKDGIAQATQLQSSMETLGAAVEAQGGKWSDFADGVQKWADTEAMASGIAVSELIPALNSLVTAGISLSDSQKMIAVAEEVAIGTHKSLTTVVEALKEAEAGRGMMLVRLDTHLKNLIHTHGKMSDAMKILHHDFEKQLSLDKSLERAHARLKAEQDAVARSIGDALMPALTDMQYGFLGGMKAAGLMGKGIGEVFHGIVIEVASAAEAVGHFAEALGNLAKMDFKGAAAQFGEARSAAQRFQFGGAIAMEGGADFTSAMNMSWVNAGRHAAGAAVKAHQDALGNLDLQNDPNFGFPKTGHAGGHAGKHGAAAKHHAKSLGADYNFKEMEDGLKPGKKAADDFDAALSRLPKTIAGITTAMGELKKRINDETAAQNELILKQAQSKTLYEDLRTVYNAYGASLGKHPTKAEKEQLAELAKGVKDAKTQYEHLTVAVDANAAALKKHKDEAAKDLAELAAKHKEAFDKMHSQAEKYANETISFFEKMGKSGKGIFKDLEAAFAQMIANMIKKFVESKLTDIFMKFMGGGTTAAGGTSGGGFLSGLLSLFGGQPGLSAASRSFADPYAAGSAISTSVPGLVSTTSGMAQVVHIGGIDSSLTGGGPGGFFAGGAISPLAFGALAIGGGAGIGGLIGGLEGHQNGSRNGAIGGALGAVGIGALFGSGALGIAGATGAGGLLGGLGGLAALGPAGWAALLGAIAIGGLAGGMFGGKAPNAHDNPDQAGNPQAYGQFVTNMNADPNGHFGNLTIGAEQQYASTGEAAQIGQELKNLPANANDALKALAAQLSALVGGSTDPNALKIASEKNGMFTLQDGKQVSVDAYMSMVSQFQTQYASQGGSAAAPVFAISRTYPDFNKSSIAGAPGTPGGPPGPQVPNEGGGGTGGHPRPGHGDITINVQGSLIGDTTDALILKISQGLSKMNRGQVMFAGAGARRFGNF